MRAVTIATKDVTTVVRDWKALTIMLAMPLLLLAILGAALGPMFSLEDRVRPFTVAVVHHEGDVLSEPFLSVLESEGIARLFTVRSATSEDEALSMVKDGVAAAAIVIPFVSPQEPLHVPTSLRIYSDPDEPLQGQIVQAVADAFAEQYSAIFSGVSQVAQSLLSGAEAAGSPGGPAQVARSLSGVQERMVEQLGRSAGLVSSRSEEANWISATQYYTVSMTAMFVLFGAMFGSRSIVSEKTDGTLPRVFSTPATKADVILGKALATFAVCFGQIVLLVAFTSLVYKTSWGDLRGALLLSAALAFSATGFSIASVAMAKTQRAADAIQNIGVQVLAFLGGCQMPIYIFPPILSAVSRLTLTRWGIEGYLALMEGRGVGSVVRPAGVLFLMGVVFLAVGIWRVDLGYGGDAS